MGRCQSALFLLIMPMVWLGLAGCGSSRPRSGPTIPGSIRLSPTIGSIDLGSTLSFIVTINGTINTSVPVTYASSNPAVLTIANNGLACAGTWDDPASPVVCTPKGIGVALVTASSSGITSSPVTVYVHQHIDQISVMAVPRPPTSPPLGPGGCYSTTTTTQAAETQIYQANAYSNGADITATVGPFNWSSVNAMVATLTPLSTNQILQGQAQVTAKTPGRTQIFASIANTNSVPIDFSTCAVQSISLAIATTGGTSFLGPKGNFTVNSTLTDINGQTITGVALAWSSTQPAVAGVPASASNANVSGAGIGGATITASCAPPSCNIGIVPMQAVYSINPVSVTFTGSPSAATAYVSSTGCANNTQNCTTSLLSVGSSPPSSTSVSSAPNPPNSLRFSADGTTAYLGSTKGLLRFTAGGSTPLSLVSNIVTGKVLAVSSDGKRVIVSDTQAPIQQIWVVDATSGSPSITNFLISGARAAAFSTDNLKAYILAGSTLYVYSSQQPLQPVPLSAPGTDVAFLGNGTFGYLAEGNAIEYLPVCDVPNPATPLPAVSTPAALVRQLPGTILLALAPPTVSIVSPTFSGVPSSGTPPVGDPGCPLPFQVTYPGNPPMTQSGYFGISANAVSTMNLGQGVFSPVAFLVSSDGLKAYIAASNLGSVLVVDIANAITSSIPLAGSPVPLAADLSADGHTLFVSANDANVHVIDTGLRSEIGRVAVPSTSLCSVTSGTAPSCLPDLLAVRP